MAKTESEIREKKEKKDKKRKHEETAEDPSSAKKDKKKKRKSVDAEAAVDVDGDAVINAPKSAATELVPVKDEDGESKEVVKVQIPLAALVPFANPLADEKQQKKVYKGVKKGISFRRTHMSIPETNHIHPSRQIQSPQARRKRMRQSNPQIARRLPRPKTHRHTQRHRHPRRRHLANGRHLAHPRAVRGPRHPLHFRPESCGAGRGGQHEEADECGDDDAEAGEGGEGGGEGGVGGEFWGFA